MSIPGETAGGVAKCRLFSQTSKTSEQNWRKNLHYLKPIVKANDSTMKDICHTFVPYQDSTKEMPKTVKPVSSWYFLPF